MTKVKVIVDGVEYEVDVEELGAGRFKVAFEDKEYTVEAKGIGLDVGVLSTPTTAAAPSTTEASVPVSAPSGVLGGGSSVLGSGGGEGVVTAPMPGKILRILVKEGEEVKTGQGLITLEAMKMENEIPAPKNGTIKKILVKEGDTVNTGDPLIEIR